MTMKQIEQSLAMFRKSCSEKVGVDLGNWKNIKFNVKKSIIVHFSALVQGLHRGEWPDDVKSLKVI